MRPGPKLMLLLAFSAVPACTEGDGGSDGDDVTPMAPTPATTDDSGGSTAPGTGSTAAPVCGSSDQCPDGACAAPHTAGLTEPPAPELFVCRDHCIENDFVALWCLDDGGCCDADATCARGLCVTGGVSTGTGTTTGSASSSDAGSETTTGGGTLSTSGTGTGTTTAPLG